MKMISILFLTLVTSGFAIEPLGRVMFLPFDDRVKLNEAWDLAVDVPRWFSVTVDTIGGPLRRFEAVPFDTVLAVYQQNKWSFRKAPDRETMVRLAARFQADHVVFGTVRTFKVVKRAIVTDGMLGASHATGRGTTAKGGTTVMGGLHDYTATVRIDVEIFGSDGALKETLPFDSEAKDGGLKVWLPMQMDSDQFNFYHLSRNPFGSDYFHKSVVGFLMKDYSLRLNEKLLVKTQSRASAPVPANSDAKEFIEGKVLGRSGSDLYLDIGIDDNVFLGELFEVLKPTLPIISQSGDTLGWMEEPVATIKIRSLKSGHFSQAYIIEESTPVLAGWNVRLKIEEKGVSVREVDSGEAPLSE